MNNSNRKLILNGEVIDADYVSLRLHRTGMAVLEMLTTEDEVPHCLSVDNEWQSISIRYGDFCGRFAAGVRKSEVADGGGGLSITLQFKYSEPERATVECRVCGKENEGYYINDDEVFAYCECMRGLF